MARPLKCRRISGAPKYLRFKPCGVPLRNVDELKLTMDEFEALRLADLVGLYQEAAAEEMNISRQTLANILNSARRKVADAIVNGKLIRIEGGSVLVETGRYFRCDGCSHRWQGASGEPSFQECPRCRKKNLYRVEPDDNRPGGQLKAADNLPDGENSSATT